MSDQTDLEVRVKQLEAGMKGLIVQGMARDIVFSLLIKSIPNMREQLMKFALEDVLPTLKNRVGATEAEQAFIKAIERQIQVVNGSPQELSEVMRRQFHVVQTGRDDSGDPA